MKYKIYEQWAIYIQYWSELTNSCYSKFCRALVAQKVFFKYTHKRKTNALWWWFILTIDKLNRIVHNHLKVLLWMNQNKVGTIFYRIFRRLFFLISASEWISCKSPFHVWNILNKEQKVIAENLTKANTSKLELENYPTDVN